MVKATDPENKIKLDVKCSGSTIDCPTLTTTESVCQDNCKKECELNSKKVECENLGWWSRFNKKNCVKLS
jgi:hypothetical protein